MPTAPGTHALRHLSELPAAAAWQAVQPAVFCMLGSTLRACVATTTKGRKGSRRGEVSRGWGVATPSCGAHKQASRRTGTPPRAGS